MTDISHARPAVRDLTKLLRTRRTYGRPCYIKRNTRHAALIVPHLRDGVTGPYSWLRTFHRATIDDALQQGFVILGGLGPVPEHDAALGAWYGDMGHQGRTIALPLRGGAR
jgi:hypothetical protein